MLRLPPPTEFVGRALPRGLPVVAGLVNERTGLFQSALDPDATPGDPGLFGPGSPTWDLVGQPSQTLGGLRAALLQSLTFTDSIMVAADRFGAGRLPRARADQYVREQSTHAALLDHRVDLDAIFADPDQRAELQAGTLPLPLIEEGELPTTVRELKAKIRGWVDELFVTDLTRQLIDATVRLTELPERQRRLLRPFVLATLSTVPDDLHELMAPTESRVEEHLAAQAVQGPLMLLQALFGPSPARKVAHRRVAAGQRA